VVSAEDAGEGTGVDAMAVVAMAGGVAWGGLHLPFYE
jgi:hypothetical protein